MFTHWWQRGGIKAVRRKMRGEGACDGSRRKRRLRHRTEGKGTVWGKEIQGAHVIFFLNFVTGFVNIEQNQFDGYMFVISYSLIKIFLYLDFWNGFTELKLIMNRRVSLSGVKGGEWEEMETLAKSILSSLSEKNIKAIVWVYLENHLAWRMENVVYLWGFFKKVCP